MTVPQSPKIYHIIHTDKLESVLTDGKLLSDSEIYKKKQSAGTVIGISGIKRRRLEELTLSIYTDLHVGDCVPFYFCPRSVMLYVIHMRNHPDLEYRDGQQNILHFEFDLHNILQQKIQRWAFTDSNAGSRYFQDYNQISCLDKLDWDAITAVNWRHCKEKKSAEFLIEKELSIHLCAQIGCYNKTICDKVKSILLVKKIPIPVNIKLDWYY